MAQNAVSRGFAEINGARLYYEMAGEGTPFVMIHAGVADHRQWNNEFDHLADRFWVIRYDMRGYGRSEPVEGEYNLVADLVALLDHLGVTAPAVLMGCSMGGGVAMDFALSYPDRVRTLIMVGSGPTGLELDVASPDTFNEVEVAFEAGDMERVSELEMQIWFDGMGRTADEVDPEMRRLANEMNLIALQHEVKGLGERLPNADLLAADRLEELAVPLLIIVGEHDLPYMHAAAAVMLERVPGARHVLIDDAAHLPNMDQPGIFRNAVSEFLDEVL